MIRKPYCCVKICAVCFDTGAIGSPSRTISII